MGFLARLFTFRGKVYRLRKTYDRIREKADREDDYEKRLTALKILDQIEPTLIILEEQRIGKFDRGKFVASIQSGIEQAKAILENKVKLERAEQTKEISPEIR